MYVASPLQLQRLLKHSPPLCLEKTRGNEKLADLDSACVQV